MSFWAPVVAAALGAAGSWFSGQSAADSQKRANRMQMSLADRQMAFQERMSSTAIQRQVADARKAGINPYYLIKGSASGASSPSGAMANISPGENPQAMSGRLAGLAMTAQSAGNIVDVLQKIQTIETKKPKAKAGKHLESVAEEGAKSFSKVVDSVSHSAKTTSSWFNKMIGNIKLYMLEEMEGLRSEFKRRFRR